MMEAIVCAGLLVVIFLQITQMVSTSRKNAKIELLDLRVSKIEQKFEDGEFDRNSVVSFRAELADRIAKNLAPIQAHLKEQDGTLKEILDRLKGSDARATRNTRDVG